jgi:transposase-like protein
MPRTHAPHPPEFRAEAVCLAWGSDKSLPALAGELGVSSEAVRHWLRQDYAGAFRAIAQAGIDPSTGTAPAGMAAMMYATARSSDESLG